MNPTLQTLQTRLEIKRHQAEIKSLKQNEPMSFLTSKSAQDKLNALRSEHATLTGTSQPEPERRFLTSKTALEEIKAFETANAKLRAKLPAAPAPKAIAPAPTAIIAPQSTAKLPGLSSILNQFEALKDSQKIQFFRDNKAALKAAEIARTQDAATAARTASIKALKNSFPKKSK